MWTGNHPQEDLAKFEIFDQNFFEIYIYICEMHEPMV